MITDPRSLFRLAAAYLRMKCGGGESWQVWGRWAAHCRRLGLRDETLVLDCCARMMSRVHRAHGGVHPRMFARMFEAIE